MCVTSCWFSTKRQISLSTWTKENSFCHPWTKLLRVISRCVCGVFASLTTRQDLASQRPGKCLSTLISGLNIWIMSSSSIPTQLRRTQFSARMMSFLKCSATSEYTQRHLLLPPHLRLQTYPLHSKPVLSPSSLSHCLCSSTSYFGCWCHCGWQHTEEEGGGTSWNIMQYDTCSHQSFFLLFPPTCSTWHTLIGGAKITCMTCQRVLHMNLLFKGLAAIATLSTCPMAPLANPLWLWSSWRLLR